MIQREYRGTPDQALMHALVHADPAAHLHVADLPYRLGSWAFDHPDNVSLWFDGDGQLGAWAVLQTPFWVIDYALRSDASAELHQHLLRWADQRAQAVLGTASGRPMWFINVFNDQQQRIAEIEAAGWACQANVGENSWSKVFMVRALDPVSPDTTSPTKFTIRSLAGPSEVPDYVALHRAVFQSESMTTAWRHRTLQHPAYMPDLDLVAVTPDGRLAAFCVGWFDPLGPTGRPCGQIEPLGVHADYRGLGLGRALLHEALQRFRQQGAHDTIVETDNYRNDAFALYEAVGFEVRRDVLVYRKNFADA